MWVCIVVHGMPSSLVHFLLDFLGDRSTDANIAGHVFFLVTSRPLCFLSFTLAVSKARFSHFNNVCFGREGFPKHSVKAVLTWAIGWLCVSFHAPKHKKPTSLSLEQLVSAMLSNFLLTPTSVSQCCRIPQWGRTEGKGVRELLEIYQGYTLIRGTVTFRPPLLCWWAMLMIQKPECTLKV